ncbi:unnamed protein product [marine sediment metagenome]|uniref:Uncharacterized protein n=1 Tax=marine sediment metagenome TaxID=412755 RepID=X0V032_9ZZZZ
MTEVTIHAKTFEKDHVVRDSKGLPLGRIILRDDSSYEEGKPLDVALLTVSAMRTRNVMGLLYYLDGHPYRIPEDLPALRIVTAQGRHRVNSFIMQPVGP